MSLANHAISLMPSKASLEKAINELIEASQEWAFKGSQPPSAHSFIEAKFKAAKLRLRIMTGASKATPTRVKQLHQWEGIVKAGYEGPTDEERGV